MIDWLQDKWAQIRAWCQRIDDEQYDAEMLLKEAIETFRDQHLHWLITDLRSLGLHTESELAEFARDVKTALRKIERSA